MVSIFLLSRQGSLYSFTIHGCVVVALLIRCKNAGEWIDLERY